MDDESWIFSSVLTLDWGGKKRRRFSWSIIAHPIRCSFLWHCQVSKWSSFPKTQRLNSNRAIWESLRISSATTGNSSFVGCCTTLTQTRTCNGSQTYSMQFTWLPPRGTKSFQRQSPNTLERGDSTASDPIVAPRPDSETEDPDDDIPLAILRERLQLDPSLTFNDYLNVDRNLATGQTETEESILASLRGDLNEENEEQNNESDDETSEPDAPSMSTSEALIRVCKLQSFFTTPYSIMFDCQIGAKW